VYHCLGLRLHFWSNHESDWIHHLLTVECLRQILTHKFVREDLSLIDVWNTYFHWLLTRCHYVKLKQRRFIGTWTQLDWLYRLVSLKILLHDLIRLNHCSRLVRQLIWLFNTHVEIIWGWRVEVLGRRKEIGFGFGHLLLWEKSVLVSLLVGLCTIILLLLNDRRLVLLFLRMGRYLFALSLRVDATLFWLVFVVGLWGFFGNSLLVFLLMLRVVFMASFSRWRLFEIGIHF